MAVSSSPHSADLPARTPASGPPRRLLFVRPDAYGDLCLFEPVLRIVRDAWPQTEVAVLIRERYQDITPLLDRAGVRWLTTSCDPYREGPGDHPDRLDALRDVVRGFAPDCVVAACAAQTWLEPAVAAFLPGTRQVSLGPGLADPAMRAALGAVLPVDWGKIYPERTPVAPGLSEWERNLGLAGALLGREAPRWWPVVHVPDAARTQAARIIAEAGLPAGGYVVCAAAGTANVPIKSWPAEAYGETLAWLEKERGVPALLIGHVSERERLETAREAARRQGGAPALWLGRDGEMPVAAALLDTARLYFGNDTGALHLAAALGRPVVPIFGGGTWPRFQPVAARARTVVQTLPCFDCGWDCYFEDAPCIRTISTASVRRALEGVLDDAAAGTVIIEADGLDAAARELIDAATPRLRFLRTDSADRLRQVNELTLLTGELNSRLRTSDADRDAASNRWRNSRPSCIPARPTATRGNGRLANSPPCLEPTTPTTKAATGRSKNSPPCSKPARPTATRGNGRSTSSLRSLQPARPTALPANCKSTNSSPCSKPATRTATPASNRSTNSRPSCIPARPTATRGNGRSKNSPLHSKPATQTATRASSKSANSPLCSRTSEADRDARQQQVETLTALLKASDADRSARMGQIEELTALLLTSEADRAARGAALTQLAAHIANLESALANAAAPSQVHEPAELAAPRISEGARRIISTCGVGAGVEYSLMYPEDTPSGPATASRAPSADDDDRSRQPAANGKLPPGPVGDPAVLADLRTRLQGSQAQEQAARAEARRLARELALARRLLKFAFDGPPPVRVAAAEEIPRAPAALLTAGMIYHLDACEDFGTHTAISGWAFCPVHGWDARAAAVTIRLHHGDTTYTAVGGCVPRPDVAAHYATLPPEAGGGARGLEGAGFACEILNDSLPVGVDLKLILRLEYEGLACEQFTGRCLRL